MGCKISTSSSKLSPINPSIYPIQRMVSSASQTYSPSRMVDKKVQINLYTTDCPPSPILEDNESELSLQENDVSDALISAKNEIKLPLLPQRRKRPSILLLSSNNDTSKKLRTITTRKPPFKIAYPLKHFSTTVSSKGQGWSSSTLPIIPQKNFLKNNRDIDSSSSSSSSSSSKSSKSSNESSKNEFKSTNARLQKSQITKPPQKFLNLRNRSRTIIRKQTFSNRKIKNSNQSRRRTSICIHGYSRGKENISKSKISLKRSFAELGILNPKFQPFLLSSETIRAKINKN